MSNPHHHVHRHGPDGEWHSHENGHIHHRHRPGDHAVGRLAAQRLWTPEVHRIGRRGFLTELGRKTFALAIVGGAGVGLAACGGDDDDGGAGTDPGSAAPTDAPEATAAPEPAAEPDPEPQAEAAEPSGDEQSGEAGGDMLRWAQASLGFVSAYVLVRGNEAAVVDTGTPGSGEDIGAALATLGVGWGEVKHVILTHAHGDHVGGLSEVLAEAPTATTYAGEADIVLISAPNPIQPVRDGDDVLGLEVIETPGHTPGSISVLDTGIGLLVAGDALNTDAAGTTVTGANPDFSTDMATADDSVAKLAQFTFDTVLVGHGNPVIGDADDQVVDLALG